MRPVNPIGEPFFELSEVDSTNNYAIRQAQTQMAGHGATWFAWYQNAGKGQRGKVWNAEQGKNLMMSCITEPAFLNIDNQFILNVAVALACYDFFNAFAKSDISIKWPNDIYWKDRKAGGILIENIIAGKNWRFAVIGMGININQTLFSEDLKKAVSLKQITGITYEVLVLAKQLCGELNKRWQQLENANYDGLLAEYNSLLYKAGEKVTFKKGEAEFDAIVNGVNQKGDLIISSAKGEQSTLAFGSATWRIS